MTPSLQTRTSSDKTFFRPKKFSFSRARVQGEFRMLFKLLEIIKTSKNPIFGRFWWGKKLKLLDLCENI